MIQNNILKLKDKVPKIHPTAFIANTAIIIGDVEIEENVSIWFNCVLRGDIAKIKVGKNTNIQDGTIIHVDYNTPVIIGENVTIGHNAIIHACTIENNVRIGMGAIILNKAIIKSNSQIGAGALVAPNKIVPENELWIGCPARKARDHTKEDIDNIINNAKSYLEIFKLYK